MQTLYTRGNCYENYLLCISASDRYGGNNFSQCSGHVLLAETAGQQNRANELPFPVSNKGRRRTQDCRTETRNNNFHYSRKYQHHGVAFRGRTRRVLVFAWQLRQLPGLRRNSFIHSFILAWLAQNDCLLNSIIDFVAWTVFNQPKKASTTHCRNSLIIVIRVISSSGRIIMQIGKN